VARRVALALVLAATAAHACGGEAAPSPSAPASGASTVASPSPAPSPTMAAGPATPTATGTRVPDADVSVPDDAPTTLGDDVPADRLADDPPLPPGATLTSSWAGEAGAGAASVAFAWRRGDDPLAAQNGFEVWARFAGEDPVWRAVYAFTDRPSTGVLGITFEEGDVTGDGVADVLTFEDTGGSGACGTWRVVRIERDDAVETLARQTCDTRVRIAGGDLEVREAVYKPGDAHCCPSAYRTTRLRWDGRGWKVVDRVTAAA
jgi:hypothetical protein